MSNYSDSHFGESNANSSWYKVFHSIPDGSKVLDVGCSAGNFGAELIKRKKCIVDGIELDASDAKLAAKKLRHVYQLNIETDDLSAIQDSYDVVYFGDVIEHLVNPSVSLRRIHQLISPGGYLLFSIPNMAHVTVRLQLLAGSFDYSETGTLDKTHLHFYTLDEIKRVLAEAGYNLDHIDFVEKDYPDELVEKYLASLGLQANASFYIKMHQPEAAAFQFVGRASVAKGNPKVTREQFGPIDMFESFFKNTVGPLRRDVVRLQAEATELRTENQRLHTRIKNPVRYAAGALKRRIMRKKR